MNGDRTAGRTPTTFVLAGVVLVAAIASVVIHLGRPIFFEGEESQGLERTLFADGRKLTEDDAEAIERFVERVNGTLRGSGAARPPLSEDLSSIAEEAIALALVRADSLGLSAGEAGRSLRALEPSMLALRWSGEPFDGVGLLASSMSSFGPAPRDHGAVFPAGVTFFAEISAQATRWPTGPNYTDHPELVMPQARVTWVSAEPAGFVLGEVLADVVAERAADILERAAEESGWIASPDHRAPVPDDDSGTPRPPAPARGSEEG